MMNWLVKRAALVASPDMEKHVDLDYRRGWGPSYAPIHSRAFEKIALSTYIPDKIIAAAKALSPRQDGRYVHVNAVGAAEAYGSNRNGDEFPEWGLLHLPPPPDVEAFLREKKIAIPEEYGYETFEKYAYPFLFHNNSDPKFSVGEQVVCAGYNERMRRVELIIFILTTKAPELVAMVDKGDAIPWSMGCKVPFDVCTICKNTAKNRTEYCEHLRSLMNVILPDGRRVAAANLFPKFFDISRVTVPAFPAAYSLRKVAGAAPVVADPSAIARAREYAPCDLDFHKIASVQTAMRATTLAINVKQASIVKEVPAEPGQDILPSLIGEKARKILKSFVTKDMAGSPMIPRIALLRMQQELGLDGVLRGATASGIVLREPEVRVLSENGQPFPDSIDLDRVTPDETGRFTGMIPTRSLFDPPFAKRVVRLIKVMRIPRGAGGETSTDYDKYLRAMRGMSPAALLEAANRLEILQARDGNALDNSLVGNKTAGVQFETVLPFLIGVGVE